MTPHPCFAVGAILAISFHSSAALASEVHVVAETGGDFTTLQAAIDAAVTGDVVLVQSNFTSESAVIDGKAITLVADPAVYSFHVEHLFLRVRNTPAGTTTVIRGARLANQAGADGVIEIEHCQGHVHLEDVVLSGPEGAKAVLVATAGRPSLILRDNASVSIHSSVFTGGRGFDTCLSCLEYGIPLPPTYGGPGAIAIDTRMSVHDTVFAGGAGGAFLNGTLVDSGCGLQVSGGSAILSGTTACAGAGMGHGLLLEGSFSAPLQLHDTHLVAGSTGGQPLFAPLGATTVLPGHARSFAFNGPLREQEIAPLTFEGEPGDLVLLAIGVDGATLPNPPLVGWLEIDLPLFALTPIATLSAPSGSVTFPVTVPDLPPGIEAVALRLQPLFLAGPDAVAGPSTAFVILSSTL